MKLFKRVMTLAMCATSALSLSGCSMLFGNRCTHRSSNDRGYDEQSHYRICVDCGKKYDIKSHDIVMTYLNGNDTSQHFMKCLHCDYSHSYQPHVMSDWDHTNLNSIRNCTVEGCFYKDTCTHYGSIKYVVDDEGHYTTCVSCNADISDKTEHIYKIYSDLTETTHSLSCECGKVSSETAPHDFKYKRDKDSHWQTCACGFETDKVDCTYGDFVPSADTHYKVCSVCEGVGMSVTHSHTLTAERKMLCSVCGHEEEPYDLLVGTWKYSFDGHTYKLTLNDDWSYTLVYYSSAFSGGEIDGRGDYSVRFFTGVNGNISGTIYLRVVTGYNTSAIEFSFNKGVTDSFRDSTNRLYTKQK